MAAFKATYSSRGFSIDSNGIGVDDITLVLGSMILDKIGDFDLLNAIIKLSIVLGSKEEAQKVFFEAAHQKIGEVKENLYFEITEDMEMKVNSDFNFLSTLFGVLLIEMAYNFDNKTEFFDTYRDSLAELLKIRDKMIEDGAVKDPANFAAAYLATALDKSSDK